MKPDTRYKKTQLVRLGFIGYLKMSCDTLKLTNYILIGFESNLNQSRGCIFV